jgi:NTE family protein
MPGVRIPKVNRALIFQGYGALGAYEAGVFRTLYENLSKEDKESGAQGRPLFDIVAGTSTGAINAAIIVSHVVENRRQHPKWSILECWEGSPDKLEKFWKFISSNYIPDQLSHWNPWHKFNPNMATEEDARRYYVAKEVLGQNIQKFVVFPISTSFENGEPRLLLLSVDVEEGETVTFDSYTRETRYEVSGNTVDIEYAKGIQLEHLMASASIQELFQVESIGGRMFWDGGGLGSSSPVQEIIRHHRRFWFITLGLRSVPNLEIYLANMGSSKVKAPGKGEMRMRIRDRQTTIAYRNAYDEKVAQLTTDYVELTIKLIELAKDPRMKKEVDKILNSMALSKRYNGSPRKYRDLVVGQVAIKKIVYLRKDYLGSISELWPDFTIQTIELLIREGERDAAAQIISTLTRTFEVINTMYDQKMKIERGTRGKNTASDLILPEQKGNTVIFKTAEYKELGRITAEQLEQRLGPEDEKHISTLEEAVRNRYNTWGKVYPQLSIKADPIEKAKLEGELDAELKEMCKDLDRILKYYQLAGRIPPMEKYRPYESLCYQDEPAHR